MKSYASKVGAWLAALTSALFLLCGVAQPCSAADGCDALRPNPPQNLSKEAVGNIDAKLSGLTGRLLNAGRNLEGTYKEGFSDVLKDYPNQDNISILPSHHAIAFIRRRESESR
jgi:hypothetical protein